MYVLVIWSQIFDYCVVVCCVVYCYVVYCVLFIESLLQINFWSTPIASCFNHKEAMTMLAKNSTVEELDLVSCWEGKGGDKKVVV